MEHFRCLLVLLGKANGLLSLIACSLLPTQPPALYICKCVDWSGSFGSLVPLMFMIRLVGGFLFSYVLEEHAWLYPDILCKETVSGLGGLHVLLHTCVLATFSSPLFQLQPHVLWLILLVLLTVRFQRHVCFKLILFILSFMTFDFCGSFLKFVIRNDATFSKVHNFFVLISLKLDFYLKILFLTYQKTVDSIVVCRMACNKQIYDWHPAFFNLAAEQLCYHLLHFI